MYMYCLYLPKWPPGGPCCYSVYVCIQCTVGRGGSGRGYSHYITVQISMASTYTTGARWLWWRQFMKIWLTRLSQYQMWLWKIWALVLMNHICLTTQRMYNKDYICCKRLLPYLLVSGTVNFCLDVATLVARNDVIVYWHLWLTRSLVSTVSHRAKTTEGR